MTIALVVGIPLLAVAIYGAVLIRRVLKPWGGNPPVGLKQPPQTDKLRKCPGCGQQYHPSWGRICADCSGAS